MFDAQIAIPTGDGRIYYDMAGTENPCIGCSACCRHFRVSFYHGELDTQPGGHVPADMTVQLSPFRACMRGTESGHGRCVALLDNGLCGIYAQRPSVCREFPVWMADGSMNPDCVRLRIVHGIAALPHRRQEAICDPAPIPECNSKVYLAEERAIRHTWEISDY